LKQWNALRNIEMSKSIKCPDIATFLVGMKKIQEFLTNREHLNELCNNDSALVASFESVFAEFLRLDDDKSFERVLKNPENFVLKPQREGGGNNFYSEEIREILVKMLRDRKKTNENNEALYNKENYIVMELLKPFVTENYIISAKSQQQLIQNNSQVKKSKINNELGIYGVLVK
jgi:hypothetical protein